MSALPVTPNYTAVNMQGHAAAKAFGAHLAAKLKQQILADVAHATPKSIHNIAKDAKVDVDLVTRIASTAGVASVSLETAGQVAQGFKAPLTIAQLSALA
jgi:hypothetical protein